MKRLISIVMILVIALSLVACGDNELVGKWLLDGSEEIGMEIIMEFTEDEMIFFGVGTPYEIKGNQIVITFDGEEEFAEFEVKGDTLTFSADGEEQTFTRVKDE